MDGSLEDDDDSDDGGRRLVLCDGPEVDQRSMWQLNSRIWQYGQSVRTVAEKARFVSIAGPDGSRVGHKKLLLSVGAVPHGACWHNVPKAGSVSTQLSGQKLVNFPVYPPFGQIPVVLFGPFFAIHWRVEHVKTYR